MIDLFHNVSFMCCYIFSLISCSIKICQPCICIFLYLVVFCGVQNLMIDEADEAMPGQQSSRKRSSSESPASPRPNKRKPGVFAMICSLHFYNNCKRHAFVALFTLCHVLLQSWSAHCTVFARRFLRI